MSEQKISIDDAETLLRGRMGLIFGPGITLTGEFYKILAGHLASKWGGQAEQTYIRNAQQALDTGASADEVKTVIRDFAKAQSIFGRLDRIAALKWSAALSLTLDTAFEIELSRACERRTSGFMPAQVVQFPQPLPSKVIPVFKLMGCVEQNLVFSDITYAARRPTWRYAVQEFADRIQDSPVVCIGLEGCQWLFWDLLSQMLSEPKTNLRPLILIESEFNSKDRASLIELTQGRTHIVFVTAPLADLISRIKDAETGGSTQLLPLQKSQSELDRLAPFQDIVALVNSQLSSPIGSGERAQLLDLLFSPALPRWDPFYHKLDFRRSIENQILDAVLKPGRAGRRLPVFSIMGSAASGKTTVAKRIAFDLASKGNLVFWVRRTFYPNVQAMLNQFFEVLAGIADKKKRIFIFVDDPLGLGSVSMQNIATSAQNHGVKCTFIVVARASDWSTHEPDEITGALDLQIDFRLSDQFDTQELASLPNYLVALQICPDKKAAQVELSNSPSRMTADTLGLLYWLLPKTRRTIEASVQEEFFRLGERAGLSRVIIGAYNKTSTFLRQAYAMAAVCDHYHVPVPVEVLVSALNVSYQEWMESIGKGGPAWGLLYGEPSADGQTICYRPRNSIVTRILIETINGGKLARAGEVEQLLKLFRACTGTSPVYREFCISILVPRTKLSHLTYADGLQLYDAALSALPVEDRTLKHQKGLWIKDKGDDPILAKSILESALAAKSYPYADRVEADEHIHTSIAATILDAADQSKIDLDEAMVDILQHLDHARSDAFFNPRAVHVQANLMLRLVSRLKEQDSADTYNLLNQAIDDVDSALLVLKNPLRDIRDHQSKDIEFLEDVSGKIYQRILPLGELNANADELWKQFKRQEGFVIAARKLYNIAREKSSGTAYNEAFAYCRKIIDLVQAESQPPSGDLCAVAVCIYYEWNVNRYDKKSADRQIDWVMLYELSSAVLRSHRYAGDPFYKFVCALALAQQGKWPDAEPLFAQTRRARIPNEQLYEPRAVLLDSAGVRKHVQGIITGGEGKYYLRPDDIDRDFFLSRNEHWPRQDEIAYAYITFSFAGPLAVQSIQ